MLSVAIITKKSYRDGTKLFKDKIRRVVSCDKRENKKELMNN